MTKQPRANAKQSHRRAGYLYLAVMMVAVLVSLSGLSAITVSGMRARTSNLDTESARASRLAQSGIEAGLAAIRADANWRQTFQIGVEYPQTPVVIDGGTMRWLLSDDDGMLDDDDSDNVFLYGIGRSGAAVKVQSVELFPSGQPLDCLNASFVSDGTLALGWNVNWTSDQTISSNRFVIVPWFGQATLEADVEASRRVWGPVSGTVHEGVSPRQMPGNNVFDYYLRRGTWIDAEDLPTRLGRPYLEEFVLSPTVNPFGPANSSGIYVIDCGKMGLTISNARIVGTLVLVNSSSATLLRDAIAWQSAAPGMPSLLVDGSIRIEVDQNDLSEPDLLTNFNPPTVPFQGSSDIDLLDQYPSMLQGLYYASGRLWFSGDETLTRFDGVTVCDSLTARASVEFNYSSTPFDSPPPGFSSGPQMSIIPGSWRRAALD